KTAEYMEKIYRTVKYTQKKEYKNKFKWVKRYNEHKFHKEKREFVKLVNEADLDGGASWKDENWKKGAIYLKKIKKLCDKNNIKLVLICFPAAPQITFDAEWHGKYYPQKKLQEVCNELSIICIDLLPHLMRYRNEAIFIDQCHYNGNCKIAYVLYNIIKENPKIFDFEMH
ncbi:MAG: hypothetical protein ABIH89_09230, partial [Elusimicrobiota bacterium]